MKINGTAAKHIKKYCYIVGLLSFLLAFFVCSQMIRYQEKEKKAVGTYMAQSTIRRVKEKLDNYITISDLLGNYIIDGSDMDENTFSGRDHNRNLSYAGKFRGSWPGSTEGT